MRKSGASSLILQMVVIVLSMIGTLALFINPRFDDLHRAIDRVESRIDSLEIRLDNRIDGLEARMDAQDTRIDGLETRMVRLEAKMDVIVDIVIATFDDGELSRADLTEIWERIGAE